MASGHNLGRDYYKALQAAHGQPLRHIDLKREGKVKISNSRGQGAIVCISTLKRWESENRQHWFEAENRKPSAVSRSRKNSRKRRRDRNRKDVE